MLQGGKLHKIVWLNLFQFSFNISSLVRSWICFKNAEIVVSGGMSMPQILSTLDSRVMPVDRIRPERSWVKKIVSVIIPLVWYGASQGQCNSYFWGIVCQILMAYITFVCVMESRIYCLFGNLIWVMIQAYKSLARTVSL